MTLMEIRKAASMCDMNSDGIVCKHCPYRERQWDGAWEDDATGLHCWDELRSDVLAVLDEAMKMEDDLK